MIKDQLIYVAHPFGGNKENKFSIDTIMKNLVMLDKNNTYLSPLHNFSMVYFEDEYAKGLKICLDMLNRCVHWYYVVTGKHQKDALENGPLQ